LPYFCMHSDHLVQDLSIPIPIRPP
jgi:hypothetical protein